MQLAADKDPADIHFCNSVAATFVLAYASIGVAVIPELFIPNGQHISSPSFNPTNRRNTPSTYQVPHFCIVPDTPPTYALLHDVNHEFLYIQATHP